MKNMITRRDCGFYRFFVATTDAGKEA